MDNLSNLLRNVQRSNMLISPIPMRILTGCKSGGGIYIRSDGNGASIQLAGAAENEWAMLPELTNTQLEWLEREVYILRDAASKILEERRSLSL